MADDPTPQQDRTEAPTQRRLQRAREEGRVPVSREVHSFVGLLAVTLALAWAGGSTMERLAGRLATFLAQADALALAGSAGVRVAWLAALGGAAPFVLAALAAGVGAGLLQTGFL